MGRNLTKNQVWDINKRICEGSRVLIEGRGEVIKFLHEDHDIIMLSDNDTLVLKVFLSRVGLLDYFSDIIARNLTLEENDNWSLKTSPKQLVHLEANFYAKEEFLWTTSRTKTMKLFLILVMKKTIFALQQSLVKMIVRFQGRIFLWI